MYSLLLHQGQWPLGGKLGDGRATGLFDEHAEPPSLLSQAPLLTPITQPAKGVNRQESKHNMLECIDWDIMLNMKIEHVRISS